VTAATVIPAGEFAAFFILHFLSHLLLRPHLPVPPNAAASSQLNQLLQQQLPRHYQQEANPGGGGADEHGNKLLIVIMPTCAGIAGLLP
jgi:hypothetical protein